MNWSQKYCVPLLILFKISKNKFGINLQMYYLYNLKHIAHGTDEFF